MGRATPSEAEVASTLNNLKLNTSSNSKSKPPKSAPVADSWDDEASSGSDTETETSLSKTTSSSSGKNDLAPIDTVSSYATPNPPPPTPASPTPFEFPDNIPNPSAYTATASSRDREDTGRGPPGTVSPRFDGRRPEKTTAVAGRLIAAGLGMRAPKRTEEEKEYDRAMRDKQRKARNEEREREKREAQEKEEKKRAVWED